jgi:hypothetical protein
VHKKLHLALLEKTAKKFKKANKESCCLAVIFTAKSSGSIDKVYHYVCTGFAYEKSATLGSKG